MIITAELRREFNGLWDVKHQDKTLDQGWNEDDLEYFVLLCKSFALHDCLFPLYVIFIVEEERSSYPTLNREMCRYLF